MENTQVVTTGYTPRPIQHFLHVAIALFRFIVLVCHRRFGKTVFVLNEAIDRALHNPLKNPQYAYIAPNYTQAKRIAWNYLKEYTKNIPCRYVNESELKIEIERPHLQDKITFYLLGAENPDSLAGLYLDGVILDEYSLMNPAIWTMIIRPALADRKGWAIFIGTPRGQNHFYDVFNFAKKNPATWYAAIYKASDTNIIDKEEMEAMRLEMTDEEYQQELECFVKGTLIATSTGSIPIEKIRVNDFVVTHTNRLRPVTNIMHKKHKGTLYGIKNIGQQDLLWSTPDHPYLTYNRKNQTREWKAAKDLRIDDYVLIPKINEQPNVVNESIVKLLAWYITEGSISKNVVQFSLNTKNLKEVNHVKEIITNLNLSYSESVCRTSTIISICDTKMADFLSSNCGVLAENKHIPFNLIGGHFDLFFKELMLGDGCIVTTQGGFYYAYSTISKGLAYDIQLLCAALGRRSAIQTRPAYQYTIEGRTGGAQESYLLQIRNGLKVNNRVKDIFPTKLGIACRIKQIETKEVEEIVYNISVKEDESYVANNRIVHNCSFTAALIGSYYGKYIEDLEKAKRITAVSYDLHIPVCTAWDLGIGDTTAIWFYQLCGTEVHIIDYHEMSGKGLEYYAKIIKEKPYIYDTHNLPHDAAARSLETGNSRMETLRKLGIGRLHLLPRLSIEDGIHASRMVLPRCFFDAEKCDRGLSALKNYQKKWDGKNKIYIDKPLHDWSSNGADAFRYLALSIRPNRNTMSFSNLPQSSYEDYSVLE